MYKKPITKPLWPYVLNVESTQTQGLVAWLAGDPSDGPTLFDLSGRGNHGTLGSGATWKGGALDGGTALHLDGVGGQVTFAPGLEPTNETAAILFRPAAVSGFQMLLTKTTGNGAANNYIEIRLNGTTLECVNVGGAVAASIASAAVAGKWMLVAYVNRIGIAFDSLYVYRQDFSSIVTSFNASHNTNPTKPWRIGARDDGGGNYFGGDVGEVLVWNRPLTNPEVFSLWDPATRWQLRYQPGKTRYFPPPAAAPVVTDWQPYAIKQMPPQPEPDYDPTLRTKPATGALFHSYSTIDNWRPTAIKQTLPEVEREPGWTPSVQPPAGALYHSYSVPQNWWPLAIRQTQPEIEREPTWTLAPKQEAGALFPGFTGPVVPPWFPLRSRPQPIPAIEFAPSQGLDEKAKNLFPGFPGFRTFPFLVTFETDAAKASVRTRRHEQYVANIINSLLLQGIIVEVTPGVWKIVPR